MKSRAPKISSWFAAVGALLATGHATAQQAAPLVPGSNGDGMDTHLFRPAVDSKGFIAVDGTGIMGAGDTSFGFVLDYGRHLLRVPGSRVAVPGEGVPSAGTPALVPQSYQATVGLSVGVANIGTVGVSLPLTLMSGSAARDLGPNGALYDADQLDSQKLSTAVLNGKLRLLKVEKGLGLAVIGQVGIPVGNSPRDMAADPGVWYWPRLAIESGFGEHRWFKVGANVGYRGHTGKNPLFQQDSAGRDQLAAGTLRYGNLGTFGLGLSVRALPSLDLVGETYGTYLFDGVSDSRQKLSQEYLGGIKLFIEQNSFMTLAAGSRAYSTGFEAADVRMVLGFVFEPSIGDRDGDGIPDDEDQCADAKEDFDKFEDSDGCPDLDNDHDGILDADDQCPTVAEDLDGDADTDGCPEGRDKDTDGDGIIDAKDKCPKQPEDVDGFQDTDGCPDLDNDGDGIPDRRDQCPNDPEDKDGYADTDGCPDIDNDNDRVPDALDKCPSEPETYNGFQDEDGCPEKNAVIVEENQIVALDQIQFQTGSAKIRPESLAIVDSVAQALQEHPEFELLEVGGHADERGSDAANLKLTQARAKAVADALVAKGISPGRLISQGYGEYCPLDPRSTQEAFDKNRRVEFKVVRVNGSEAQGADRGCPRALSAGVKPATAK